jgi:precorrin-6B methylase 2
MNWHHWIKDAEIMNLIRTNENEDVAKLALQWHKHSYLPVQWMLQQITGRQIARQKLPEWYANENIVYPDRTALEQCSSTITAVYKRKFAEGERVADLTGGLGVDAWALAGVAEKLLYCEPDPLRFEIAQHNFAMLGLSNVEFLNSTAEKSLPKLLGFNPHLIYLDPSRRDNGKRFFKLEDLQPDILTLLPELLQISNNVVMKAAPMLDIKLGIRQLEKVQEVHVVSMRNECRELLFYLSRQSVYDPSIHCVEFHQSRDWKYDFRFSEEENAAIKTGPIASYILDPYASITKAGCFKMLTKDYDVHLLNANTHLYTADTKPKGFPGRCFSVVEVFPYDIGLIRESIADKKAHLLFRNFPVKPEEVEKKLKFSSGGNCYLFFVTDHTGKMRVISTQLIPPSSTPISTS